MRRTDPMVLSEYGLKLFVTKRRTRLDFPTPEPETMDDEREKITCDFQRVRPHADSLNIPQLNAGSLDKLVQQKFEAKSNAPCKNNITVETSICNLVLPTKVALPVLPTRVTSAS